jgi:uncharacterized membrane protein YedE/YeeE
MIVDWSHFTPVASLAGGVLIGTAAAALMLLRGRILGVSGIVGGLLQKTAGDTAWRVAFLLGLLAAPALWALVAPPAPFRISVGWGLLVAAGLLVGWGTRRASGCTSGHGVCGLARLSPRSLASTGLFLAAGMATVYVMRHVLA